VPVTRCLNRRRTARIRSSCSSANPNRACPKLVPIRYGRMLVSAFTFYRGAAAIMAGDLVGTPQSGMTVQCCGDAHLSNFGAFASPERRLVFELNDFDETLSGPWEWDLKRLAVSMMIGARDNGFFGQGSGRARDFYGRQLKDWKGSAEVERMIPKALATYGKLCGWTLARAHARSGDRIAIAAYLGKGTSFDQALVEFSRAYAEQNDRDHQAVASAVKSGRIVADAGL